jgi:hypothetical protein
MKKIRNYTITLVTLYLLISGVMIGMPYVRNVIFSDEMDNIARGLNYDGTILRATNRLIEAAASNNIPVTKEDFVVIKDRKTHYTLLEVKYSVTVSTPFDLYTHVWDFHPRAEYGKK